ncbi:MAG TPA: hypothetical protein VF188_15355 [Longimicrobiales bacterium]
MGYDRCVAARCAWVLGAIGCAWLLAACGAGGPAGRGADVVRTDSAGIRVIENRVDPAALPALELPAAPIVRIGVVEGSSAQQLFRVTSAVRLSDGRIAVVNSGTNELRYYGPDGVHLRSVGGAGSGPGEYRGLRTAWRLPGDSVLVNDFLEDVLAVYAPDGTLVRSWPIQQIAPFVAPPPVGRLTNGDFVAFTRLVRSRSPDYVGRTDYNGFLIRYGPDGQPGDTLAVDPGGYDYYDRCTPGGGGGGICRIPIPFFPEAYAVAAGERIFYGNSKRFEVLVRDETGALRQIWRWTTATRPVTQADVDRALAAVIALRPDDANRRRQLERWFAETPIPETMPAFSALRLDAAGNLWVEEFRAFMETRSTWAVFAPDGVLLGRVRMPDRFRVLDIGTDYVLGVRTDAMDVEFVELYALPALPVDAAE